MSYTRPAPVDYGHLDDLAEAGIHLQLPNNPCLPNDLSGCVISAQGFKALHMGLTMELATALTSRQQQQTVRDHWPLALNTFNALKTQNVLDTVPIILDALAQSTEVEGDDERLTLRRG